LNSLLFNPLTAMYILQNVIFFFYLKEKLKEILLRVEISRLQKEQ